MAEKMLEGLIIVDFTTVIAGPFITRTLASYGAKVIKIETRTHPDLWRGGMFTPGTRGGRPAQPGMDPEKLSPFHPWMNTGSQYGFWNTGKMSMTSDLANPEGVELVKKIVAHADIVVENFAGGVGKRMGVGYDDLKKVKPDIIMISTCMQGQTGPHAKHPGYGTQLVNLAGLSGISGWPDRDPAAIGPYTDFSAPQFSILALMAALDYRRRTGKGQYIDQSQYESAVHLMAPLILDSQVNGRASFRIGNKSAHSVPHNAYPCKPARTDRFVAIGIYTEEEWKCFCDMLGNPAWTRDPKFSTLGARRENEEELDCHMEEWTIQQLPEDVVWRLQNAAIPIPSGVVQSKEEFYNHQPPVKGRSPYAAPHGVYRCRAEERWCVIDVSTEEEWKNFCEVIGHPAWTQQEAFASFSARKENEDELDRLVGEWTRSCSPEQVMEMMQAAGIRAGIVATGEDLMELDPQLRHRNYYHEIRHPEIRKGRYRGVAPSFILSKNPADISRAPLMGEHNEEVLKEMLGMTDSEIKDLIAKGILN